MTIQEIIKYLNDTPNNTNPNVVASMISELGVGGSIPATTFSVAIVDSVSDVQIIYLTDTGEFEALEYNGPKTFDLTVAENAILGVLTPLGALVTAPEGGDIGLTLVDSEAQYTILVPKLDGKAVKVASGT